MKSDASLTLVTPIAETVFGKILLFGEHETVHVTISYYIILVYVGSH